MLSELYMSVEGVKRVMTKCGCFHYVFLLSMRP